MNFYLTDFYTFQMIFSVIFFAIIAYRDRTRIILLAQFLFNHKYSLIYHRSDKLIYKFFSFTNTLIIKSTILSFWFYGLYGKMSVFIFIKIMILLSLLFALKISCIYFITYTFELKDYGKKYFYNYSSVLFALSLLFFPLIFISSYVKEGQLINDLGTYIFYCYCFIYFISKFIFIKRLNLMSNRLIFYNILYLCGLELFPYFLVLKLVNSNMIY